MAMTLAQSAYYTTTKLYPKIVEEILGVSPLQKLLPHEEIVGTDLSVTYEDTANPSTAGFYGVNDTIAENTGGVAQTTFGLTTLIGDAEVNELVAKTRSNVIDVWQAQIKMKSKAIARAYEKCLIYGTGSGNNEFKGLHSSSILTAAQTIEKASGSTAAAMTIADLDKAVDLVAVGGQPDLILCNRNLRRRITAYLRTVGSYQTERDKYGNNWEVWNGIPIVVSDFITQTEGYTGGSYSATAASSSATSLFVIRLGSGDGLCGIQNGGITIEPPRPMENKDSKKLRIKWYCGLALYQQEAIAAITGISDAAVTA
jgi:hypothetical protein